MTKREMFERIANVAEVKADEEMMAFIAHEIELLDHRKTSKKGMTKTQKENIEVKETIVEVLAEIGEPATVTDLLKDDRLGMFTNQKISALLRQLALDGRVTKGVDGKKAVFSLA